MEHRFTVIYDHDLYGRGRPQEPPARLADALAPLHIHPTYHTGSLFQTRMTQEQSARLKSLPGILSVLRD